MPNKLKELLLGRGWAGRTITRAETVDRLNPIVRRHIELNHHYEAVIREHPESNVVQTLRTLQRTARMDVGKISETIFSAGGSAYNGTELEPSDFEPVGDPIEMISDLIQRERSFKKMVMEDRETVEHQIRTRAILELVASNSDERLKTLTAIETELTRTAA